MYRLLYVCAVSTRVENPILCLELYILSLELHTSTAHAHLEKDICFEVYKISVFIRCYSNQILNQESNYHKLIRSTVCEGRNADKRFVFQFISFSFYAC